jgi:hypothetical protein
VPSFCPVDAQALAGTGRDLFAVLDRLPDPRRTRWRRHPLGYVLAVVFTAFTLPGFSSLSAAAQWETPGSRPSRWPPR